MPKSNFCIIAKWTDAVNFGRLLTYWKKIDYYAVVSERHLALWLGIGIELSEVYLSFLEFMF